MKRILQFKRGELRPLLHEEGLRLVLTSRIRPVLMAHIPGEDRPAMFFARGWGPISYQLDADDTRPRDQAVIEDTQVLMGAMYGKDIEIPHKWLAKMVLMECNLHIEITDEGVKLRI